MERNNWMKRALKLATIVGAASVIPGWSQPTPPSAGDLLCSATPTTEEVASTEVDAEGFTPLFDGASWKGLWQDCQSTHSQDKTNGGIWRLAPTEKAIYSTQRGSSGGLLLTKKKYGNYEVIFDMWPSFGNDGGFFHRTTATGTCYQTVMDYIQGAAMLGTWPEANYQGSYDFRPDIYESNTDPKQITFNGNTNDNDVNKGGGGGWTKWTAKAKPAYLDMASATELGCAATGCVAADWNRLWSFDSWNQIRLKFYGGTAAGTGKIHMQSWFRKAGATLWVPVWADSITKVDPPSFIGLQVHGGGRFGGAKGNWYRNYKIRTLKDDGSPEVVVGTKVPQKAGSFDLRATTTRLVGKIDVDHEVTIRNLSGQIVESFQGKAGEIDHAFTTNVRGVLLIGIKTATGITHLQVSRI